MNNNFISDQSVFLNYHLSSNLIFLKHLSIIYIEGVDCKKFLQNQFTININDITKNLYKIGAHCNINGKVLAIFFIFKFNDGYLYVIDKSLVKNHILKLKKYSLFFKVKISNLNNFIILGLIGKNCSNIIKGLLKFSFKKNKNIYYINNIIILHILKPIERFFIILPKSNFLNFLKIPNQLVLSCNFLQWISLDIESNFPLISHLISEKFIPQYINLKDWNAISFTKGCYFGQEIICRIENKNINKSCIKPFIGFSNIIINVGSNLKYLYKDKIIFSGIVMSSVILKNNKKLLQMYLKKFSYIPEGILKLSQDKNSSFSLYSIDNN